MSIYVSTSGDNTNIGTNPNSPWLNLDNLNAICTWESGFYVPFEMDGDYLLDGTFNNERYIGGSYRNNIIYTVKTKTWFGPSGYLSTLDLADGNWWKTSVTYNIGDTAWCFIESDWSNTLGTGLYTCTIDGTTTQPSIDGVAQTGWTLTRTNQLKGAHDIGLGPYAAGDMVYQWAGDDVYCYLGKNDNLGNPPGVEALPSGYGIDNNYWTFICKGFESYDDLCFSNYVTYFLERLLGPGDSIYFKKDEVFPKVSLEGIGGTVGSLINITSYGSTRCRSITKWLWY